MVVRRAFENRADFAQVWLAMARDAKLRDWRRVRLVAVRMAAEAEVEGLMADGDGSSIYNLGGRSLDENRQRVLLRLPAAVASFHAAMLGMIGGIWVGSCSGVSWRAKALPRFADVWLTEPCSLSSRRRMPSLSSGRVRKQQVTCRASGSGHTQGTHQFARAQKKNLRNCLQKCRVVHFVALTDSTDVTRVWILRGEWRGRGTAARHQPTVHLKVTITIGLRSR